MTPYERGYAAGLKAAAALVPTDDTRELCCNGYDCECRKPEDAAFVSAEVEARRIKQAILSLPIPGEATNPGEQVPDSARIGGSHITSSPDSQGPSQECVMVPREELAIVMDFFRKANWPDTRAGNAAYRLNSAMLAAAIRRRGKP